MHLCYRDTLVVGFDATLTTEVNACAMTVATPILWYRYSHPYDDEFDSNYYFRWEGGRTCVSLRDADLLTWTPAENAYSDSPRTLLPREAQFVPFPGLQFLVFQDGFADMLQQPLAKILKAFGHRALRLPEATAWCIPLRKHRAYRIGNLWVENVLSATSHDLVQGNHLLAQRRVQSVWGDWPADHLRAQLHLVKDVCTLRQYGRISYTCWKLYQRYQPEITYDEYVTLCRT